MCGIDSCDRKFYGRGLCRYHYDKARLGGTLDNHPRRMVPAGGSPEERIRHLGWTVTDSGCWEFKGSKNGRGYGQMAVGTDRPELTHRVAFKIWNGPLGEEDMVLHRCDNPPCMNPSHLFKGTRGDNNRDTMSKGRTAKWDRRPHKLTPEQITEIRGLYATGQFYQRELGDQYGVCQQLICRIVRGLYRP